MAAGGWRSFGGLLGEKIRPQTIRVVPLKLPAPPERRTSDDMRAVLTSPGSQNSAHASPITKEKTTMTQAATTSLNGGTIHFLSSLPLTTCNDIIFIRQGVSLKDKRKFLVEKYGFSCGRHFPRLDASRDIASMSTRLLF
jgi:hypothetical protein